MENGDAAAAAGMSVVPSTAQRSMGYDEINKSRDYTALKDATTTKSLGVTGASPSTVQADLQYLNGQITLLADRVTALEAAAVQVARAVQLLARRVDHLEQQPAPPTTPPHPEQ